MCYQDSAPLLRFRASWPSWGCAWPQTSRMVPAVVGIEKQLEHTRKLLASLDKRLRYFRSDSAGYQAKVSDACQKLKVTFTITADQDAGVKATIKRLAEE